MTPAAITQDERRPVQAGSFNSQRRSMCCSKVASIVGDTETAGPFVFRVRVGVGTLTWERGQSREPCFDNHLRAFHDLMGAEVFSWSRWSMSMAPLPHRISQLSEGGYGIGNCHCLRLRHMFLGQPLTRSFPSCHDLRAKVSGRLQRSCFCSDLAQGVNSPLHGLWSVGLVLFQAQGTFPLLGPDL